MNGEPVALGGPRDVRGILDGPVDAEACVVACPPHPEYGGNRHDQRLVAVSEALAAAEIAGLRFDYGPWDGGPGEREDDGRAVRRAADRYSPVGLFGYSFGGGIALLEAATEPVAAVSVLAPAARLGPDLDAVAALEMLPPSIPVQVQYGTRDDRVSWEPVVVAARERGAECVEYAADHFFLTREADIGDAVAEFMAAHLG